MFPTADAVPKSPTALDTPPPSFPRRREGGFTFQVQHMVQNYLCRGSVAQALARCIVVGLNQPCKLIFWQGRQVYLARQSAPQAAVGVLDTALLPRGTSIAEEGLYAQVMEPMMACELGPVVEGDRPPQLRREGSEDLGDGAGDRICGLAWQSAGDDETRVSLVQGEYRLSVGMEQHQVSLPMARSLSVIGFLGAFDEWSALSDEGCRAAAPATAPAAIRRGSRQVASPGVVLRTRQLGIDEPIDALV